MTFPGFNRQADYTDDPRWPKYTLLKKGQPETLEALRKEACGIMARQDGEESERAIRKRLEKFLESQVGYAYDQAVACADIEMAQARLIAAPRR